MDRWRDKVAVVTGASAGIGAATVRALVHHGMVVVGLARRDDRMKELAAELSATKEPGKLHVLKVDLRKEEDVLGAFAWVDKELGGADVLVNNAGVAFPSLLIDGKAEDWRTVLDTNVLAVTIATREYLKSMERRNNQLGHIFIINSVFGHLAETTSVAMYTGSKHAIRAISACLRRELAEKNSTIKVTSVSPGVTFTEFFKGMTYDEAAEKFGPTLLQGGDVAKVVVDALSASDVCEICEVVLKPVPTKVALY